METLYERILSWYSDKPWWGKVLFFGVFFLLVLLSAVRLFWPAPKAPPVVQPAPPPPFGAITDMLDTQLEAAKKELSDKIGTLRLVGIRAEERRKAIRNASSMAELDELKRRYGL